jgi:hypothetical protein
MTEESKRDRKKKELDELVQGWGKLLAEEAFPEGVGLDMDLFTMEEFAVNAAKALVRGVVQTLTSVQAAALGQEQACPQCGRSCELELRQRPMQIRGGGIDLGEPVAHCSTCRRDFFPSATGLEDRRAWL